MLILRLGVVIAGAFLLAQTALAKSAPATDSQSTTPILGYAGTGATVDTGDQNSINGGRFVMGSTRGVAKQMSVYLSVLDPINRGVQLGIYSDFRGHPGRRVWHSSTVTTNNVGWLSTTVPNVALEANTAYWLFFNANGAHTAGAWNAAPSGSGWWATRNYGNWPALARGGTFDGHQYSIYLSYVANNAPAPSPTATPVPPTQTPAPSAPTATPSPVPPTSTPTVAPGSSGSTLGYSGTASMVDTGDQNSLDGGRFVMGATNGSATEMNVFLSAVDSASPGIQMGIYADQGGKPGALAWNSGTITPKQTGWVSASVPNIALKANTAYWLVFNASGSGTAADWNTAPMGNGWWSTVSFGSWPSTAPSGTLDGQQYAMYVNYTPNNSLTATPAPPTATPVPPTATPTAPASNASGFVQACGNKLCINGQPFRAIGANFYDAAGNQNGYYCGPVSSDMNGFLDSMFGSLQTQAGSNVLRFWAFQSYTNGGTDWSNFDRVIQYAKAHGFHLIVTLENQWTDCTQGGYKYDTWYQSGYKSPYGNYKLSYRDYVQAVVNHYKNEPTIMAWMLMNEAESKTTGGSSDPTALYNFAQDMTTLIHSIDPNHLVTLGTIGSGQPGISGSNYEHIYSLPYMSLVEAHDYGSDTQALPGGPISNPNTCSNSIACDVAQATTILNKPIIIGEAGIQAGSGYQWTTSQRASLFDAKINAFWQAGGSGYVIWDWRSNVDNNYEFDPGDPLNGVMLKDR